ncbi:MAG: APC family permease [Clostridia bacterium]|nr:APC family permease [Clostridia bacterium]
MMQKTVGAEYEKVFSKKDIFALAFGAMIGWGWVVLTGSWIQTAGALGAILAFLIGGAMVIFVGLAYAELTAALPESGGISVFTERALGWNASFFASWSIILGYVSVVAFEAVAFPAVLEYFLGDGYLQGYLYSIKGYDVYATWVAVGVSSSIVIAITNYFGGKSVAFLQGGATLLITVVGLALFGGSSLHGSFTNMAPLFNNGVGGVFAVAVMTPFMFMGFDVIPQAASEMNVPHKNIGKIMILSVVMAVVWYVVIVLSTARALNAEGIARAGLVTADAMVAVFGGSSLAGKVLILAGLGGIVTSWNAFFMGGSRAIAAMAQKKMLPPALGYIHPKHNTPTNAIILIGVVTTLAPLFGKSMMTWLVNAGSFTVVIAYFMVVASFLKLRINEPGLNRPYNVGNWKFVGVVALMMTCLMIVMCLPGFPAALSWPYEWGIILGWFLLGGMLYLLATVGEYNSRKKMLIRTR